jgi:hypothetical protein
LASGLALDHREIVSLRREAIAHVLARQVAQDPVAQAAADARCGAALTRAGTIRRAGSHSVRVPAVRLDPGAKGTVLRFESLKRASRERTIRAGKKAPAVIANLSQSDHSDSALTADRPAARAVRTFALAASFRRRSSKQVGGSILPRNSEPVGANFPRRSLEQGAENSRRSLANRNSVLTRRVRGRARRLGPRVPKARKAVRSVHAVNGLVRDLVHDPVNDLARDLARDLTAAPASRGKGKNARSSAISRASRGTR